MRRVSLFLPDNLLDGLERLKREHGTPQAESIRRAVARYLEQKRGMPEPSQRQSRRRGTTKRGSQRGGS